MAELDRQESSLTSLKPNMAYLVNITPRAERDFASLYQEINAGDSDAALKWYRGLKEAVLSLDDQPNRCPVTPEKAQLRHLLYGNKPHIYRVIFRVMEKQKRVEVLHVRHGARQQFKAADLG
jgi:toxin ParE1/3/4